jgi:two-component system response regulator NreC
MTDTREFHSARDPQGVAPDRLATPRTEPTVTPGRLRILLVDDHAVVREGLKLMLDRESDLEVVGEASTGTDAIECVGTRQLDVVVMDLSMSGMSGLVATRRVKQLQPHLAIVSLTRHREKTYLLEMLRAGVSGYVLKQSSRDELLRAIRAAACGQQYVDAALTHHLAASFVDEVSERPRRRISDRELQVVRLVAIGLGNKEIAQQLGLSVKTIELHKWSAMHKLDLKGRVELIRYALHNGWLQDQR